MYKKNLNMKEDMHIHCGLFMVSFTIYVCVRIKQALTRKEATYMLVDNKPRYEL